MLLLATLEAGGHKMITYSSLGKNGRLGNQMFQYATLFSVGFLRGYEVGIPKEGHELFKYFQMSHASVIPEDFSPDYRFEEPQFGYFDSIFFAPDKTDIHGYFQSPSYFRHCAPVLKKELTFGEEIQKKAEERMKIFSGEKTCSLHVRRGDYLNRSHYHTNLGSDYYQKAINIIIQNFGKVKFLIFSDDIEWCRSVFSGPEFHLVSAGEESTEMCMMSMCNIHIIANSSFSWWGSWLSGSRAVIAPKQWFSDQGPDEWDSIYEKEWIVI
jgi:hypothetical protein